jgi:glycosyltransferase involved in cell wall biosynthesis
MKDNSGISLIVPLFNKEKTVATSLEKIFQQTDKRFEVIVVDDGSSDNSISEIQPFIDRITLIRQKNQGPSIARNKGAKAANYNYLSFVDADDEICPEFVAEHLSIRNSEQDIDLSINSFQVFVHDKLSRTELLYDRLQGKAPDTNQYVISEFRHSFCTNIHSSGFCINKDIFLNTSGFDEKLKCWEISDALARFTLASKNIGIINSILSLVFEDENSLFKTEKNNLEYKQKYCDNIINYVEKIPDHSKKRYFRELEYLCYDYWKALRFRDLLRLYTKVIDLPSATKFFSPSPKILITAKLLRFLY